MTERIDEKDLALVTAAPTDTLRAVRNGKSVRVPIGSLPPSAAVQEQIDVLAAGQAAGQKVYRTWSELSATTGSAGVGAQVIDDTGTHTDPVVGGTVANAGQYVWSESPAGWRWVRPDALPLKADQQDLDVTNQALGDLQSSLDVATITPASAVPWLAAGVTVALDDQGALRVISESSSDGVTQYSQNPVAAAAGAMVAMSSLGFSGTLDTPPWDWLPSSLWGAYDDAGGLRIIYENGEFLGMGDVSSVTTEVLDARGSSVSLADRMAPTIDPYGLPTYGLHYPEYLRQSRSRLQRLRNGEAIQCDIALGPGDSWTFVRGYWSENFANGLVEEYGDGGGGWVGFGWPQAGSVGNGNARGSLYGYDATASAAQGWSCGYATTGVIDASPDGCMVTSDGTAGKVLTGTYPASPAVSGGRLFYRGYGDNPVVSFRWNDEAAVNYTLTGTGVFAIDLPAPVDAGAGTWTITTVSGTARLFGLNLLSTATGVRIHKLAASGSASFGWGNTSATFGQRLQDGFALLAPHLIVVMLGVNDSKSGRTVEQYTTNMSALIGNLRAGAPAADILLVSQPEISSPGTVPIAGYRQALKRLAYQNRCAYLDLQPAFGPLPVDYGPDGVVPLLIADGIHPNNGGSAVIQAAILNAIGA